MNKRIQKLRQQSVDAIPRISSERAQLLTEFYQSGAADGYSIPIQRAKAFYYILDNKALCINEGELIVGERGEAPKATPTYPEVCIHTPEDLEVLDQREKVAFKVDEKNKAMHVENVLPFWKGKSHREKVMMEMTDEWKNAYAAGVFTEFQEQRAPGHTVSGDKIYTKGLSGLKKDIHRALSKIDFYNDPQALDKKEELIAMEIAADAVINYAHRYADELKKRALAETDDERKRELLHMSEICRKVPEYAPETFWEALQCYWFIHLGVITETNPWDAFNPGRLDQHLYPFYQKEVQDGTLDEDQVKELLSAFWVKFNNHPAPPKVGITARESNTYVDFALINLGGLTTDGKDAVNELSYIILDVISEMRILQPSSMVQISRKNPDRFLKKALKIIKTGFGQPSIFNTDAIIDELINQGKSVEDARNGGASGCVETGAFGKESYILTGYFNLAKIVELTLNGGYDRYTDKQIGLKIDPSTFDSFETFMEAYRQQLNYFIDIKIRGNNVIERLFSKYIPVPFLSILIDDCIETATDYNSGGARYNTNYIQGVGLGTTTDALASIKYNVFDQKKVSLPELQEILQRDYEDREELRQTFLTETPKYGNDNDYADDIMQQLFHIFHDAVNLRPNTKGGCFRINLLPTTSHVYFGSVIGALPDGRKKGKPLSEGISPVQGRDVIGPTAVIKSASKIDQIKTGGTLLNQKFTPDFLETETGVTSVVNLVRTYFKMDGHHIQFNVVDKETLRKAQKNPENYKDLIVRVAGYSDYFVDITPELQEEIINRTEYSSL